MMKYRTLIYTVIMTFAHQLANANEPAFVDENLWTTGKIYVVLAVVLIIFLGIVFFLLHLENRIKKLEK